ncbi:tyrosine--tRNA ligase [Sinanaerobacter chloroacetimidivorans]|uniref:Tyrosine--tRNA ligase n=1 Tax=Sinanaerobacter chloroacetimidivorans TaxID=2818044 RepID=A0A8J7W2B6_9FIRM|nr:tyrosine--tRNA ligase [Sinanaerobacter chloroacetimidivorans]MBR0599597.1 tyrosine--tRNA ligase [Sinanaerobacter chloroacetimidivorans]
MAELQQERNVYDVLMERGLIKQTTHEQEIRELLGKEKVTFYIGFDPTADSLHVGHFMQIIVMMYMQKYGHKPIVLIGGGTGMVGDPSGRSDMRTMMTKEVIINNCNKFKETFSKFIDFSDGKAIIDNNADWLLELNYVDFIRTIGRHFSVNRMLTAECFKQRLETGLSFLEFNYMLMQSYDFLELHRRYNCKMQFGGDDQWSNILGGVDLVRREMGDQVYGMTFALLTTSEGKKMGKTQKGALWLDPNKTTPYEFYQYWRNVEDADVKTCLSMLTFLPMDEVNELASLKDAEINKAKEVLAYEVTKLVHSEEEAAKAQEAARALFSGGGNLQDVPKTQMPASAFEGEGMGIVSLIADLKLVSSKGDGFRTIEQGGLSIDDVKVTDTKLMVTKDLFKDGKILIKKGKKTFHLVELI